MNTRRTIFIPNFISMIALTIEYSVATLTSSMLNVG